MTTKTDSEFRPAVPEQYHAKLRQLLYEYETLRYRDRREHGRPSWTRDDEMQFRCLRLTIASCLYWIGTHVDHAGIRYTPDGPDDFHRSAIIQGTKNGRNTHAITRRSA